MPRQPTSLSNFDATLALGSNMGDKAANIDRAIASLTAGGEIELVKRSRNFRSAAWGVKDQDWFVNACITVATRLSPRELLERCQDVENTMGRVRREKWGPRLIDVDIITFRGETIGEPDLIVPHPYAAERAFVLIPLLDVAPGIILKGRSLDDLIARLGVGGLEPMSDPRRKKTPPA